jgi:hypothetical protein
MPRASRAAASLMATRRARVDREPRFRARPPRPWRPGGPQLVPPREMRRNPFALYPLSLEDALREFLAEGSRPSKAPPAKGRQKRQRTTRKPSTAKPDALAVAAYLVGPALRGRQRPGRPG